MMVVLLMESLPRSLQLVGLADKLAARQDSPAGRALTDNAVEFALDSLDDAPLRGPNLAQATRHIRRVVIMLNDLDGNAGHRPVRRTRIERIRRKLDAACRKRLATELSAGLLAPAAALASAGEAEIAALEVTAHTLRRFGAIARQICGADPYDAQMRRAAEVLRPGAAEDAAVRGARVRLVESLLGPDAAVAVLKANAAKGPAA